MTTVRPFLGTASRTLAALILTGLLAMAPALAAPTDPAPPPKKPAAPKPAAAKPAKAKPAAPKPAAGKGAKDKAAATKPDVALQKASSSKTAKPTALPPTTPLGATFLVSDLRRIVVGNQAGILKVTSRETGPPAFIKDAPGTEMKGIDGVQWAPLQDRHRQAILAALGIQDTEIDAVADKCVTSFDRLPPLQTLGLLGLLASHTNGQVTPATRQKIHELVATLLKKQDVVLRRHAVLALALASSTDEPTVGKVVEFMAASSNAWETFSVQQFFDYHRTEIRQMSSIEDIRQRVQSSGNPYATPVLQMLQ